MKPKIFSFNDPINPMDTETQTEGCRAFNPEFCSDHGCHDCAFVNPDGICRRPRRTWKKQFHSLMERKK